MEFLVEFEVIVPEGTAQSEVDARQAEEASAAAELIDGGTLPGSGRSRRRPERPGLPACTGPTAAPSSIGCSADYRCGTG